MTVSELNEKQVSVNVSKVSMLISAICMGNVGLLVTLLAAYPIYSIVLFRGLFGTLFLTIFMIKSHSFSKSFIKESLKLHWKPLLVIGILNPVVIYFYFLYITISGYAIAAFMLYTSGIFLVLFLVITKEEKVSRITIISFIIAMAGVAIIMELWTGQGISVLILIGILSGLTLAMMTFTKKKIYRKREEMSMSLKSHGDFNLFMAWWSTLFIIIVFLPFGIMDIPKLTLMDLIWCLILGFFPTALAFTLYNIGVRNDKGGNIVILAYLEPVMATIITVIFLKTLSIYTIIGGSLILFANILVLKYSK